MAPWQKRARLAVAVFGVACAVIVYFAIGRRQTAAPTPVVNRVDPKAVLESTSGTGGRFRGDKRDFELNFERQFAYADGRKRLDGVRVRVTKDDGRSFVVTAQQAESAGDEKQLQLSGGITLKANDGFEMTTERARYDQATGAMHSDGTVAFTKARMSGSGTGVDYNETTDVLTVAQQARITTVDAKGATTLALDAGSAVLDRLQDVLLLDGAVHVLRGAQTMDADRATAHLSPMEEFITFIELRGNSRVKGGGGALEAMNARDIDLHYTDDGQLLQSVVLNGMAAVALAGANGVGGRQFTGDSLDVQLGPDGMVRSASGRDNVRMSLPAAAGASARSISAKSFNTSGPPGQGLTSAHFSDAVEYREEGTSDVAARVVHSRELDLVLAGDAVTDATFLGDVTFDEQGFRAQSADARYNPSAGSLRLTGSDPRGAPCVADEQISVEAQTIDVTVESRRLTASGRVKTTLRPRGAPAAAAASPCARGLSGATRAQGTASDTRLPGLLKQDQPATVTADNLEYGGTGQALLYTGSATLVQGETAIRGNRIHIDQERGDLVVSGGARSLLVQGTGESPDHVDGRADEIRYTDATRLITYLAVPPPGKSAATVQVDGPEGNLFAKRIEFFLAADDGRAERVEAYEDVTAMIGTKQATGARLTYHADQDQYDMRGSDRSPLHIVDRSASTCREMSGKALIFSKSTDRIVVDGREEMLTQTKSGGPCPPPRPTSR